MFLCFEFAKLRKEIILMFHRCIYFVCAHLAAGGRARGSKGLAAYARQGAGRSGGSERAPAAARTPEPELEVWICKPTQESHLYVPSLY